MNDMAETNKYADATGTERVSDGQTDRRNDAHMDERMNKRTHAQTERFIGRETDR